MGLAAGDGLMSVAQLILPRRSNPGRFGNDSAIRLINCYAEDAGVDAKEQYPVYAIDGLSAYATLTGGGKVRAATDLETAGLYVVSNRSVFKVTTAGTATSLGTIGAALSTGMVTMVRNRRTVPQIGIVLDGLYYTIAADVITQFDLNAASLPAPNSIAILDGIAVLFFDSGKFNCSDVDDMTTFGATATAKAESKPDAGVRATTRGRELLFFGTRSTEFWSNTGGTPVPFSRTTTTDFGLLCADSPADLDESLAFVAHDGTVRKYVGYQAQRISTHAVERAIAAVTDKTTIKGTSWQDKGHWFYQISSDAWTWVYDSVTGLWHERQSFGLNRWRCALAYRWNDTLLFGDYAQGLLYRNDANVFNENGTTTIVTLVLPASFNAMRRMQHDSLMIDCITGVGLLSGDADAQNPQLMIDYSDDGGVTYGAQRFEDLGVEGDRTVVVQSTRLGMSPYAGRTYRLSASSSVVRCFLSAWLSYTQLD